MINKTVLKNQFYSGQLRVFTDISLDPKQGIAKIGIVVYSNSSLVATHIIDDYPAKNVNLAERKAVEIANILYPNSRIHTDSQNSMLKCNKKVKSHLYLIKGKFNPADKLLREEDIPNRLDLQELVTNWSLSNHDSVNPLKK